MQLLSWGCGLPKGPWGSVRIQSTGPFRGPKRRSMRLGSGGRRLSSSKQNRFLIPFAWFSLMAFCFVVPVWTKCDHFSVQVQVWCCVFLQWIMPNISITHFKLEKEHITSCSMHWLQFQRQHKNVRNFHAKQWWRKVILFYNIPRSASLGRFVKRVVVVSCIGVAAFFTFAFRFRTPRMLHRA